MRTFKTQITVPLTDARKDAYWQSYEPDDIEIDIDVTAYVKFDRDDYGTVSEAWEILPDGREIDLTKDSDWGLIDEKIANSKGEWA